jgi:hypothetical protein
MWPPGNLFNLMMFLNVHVASQAQLEAHQALLKACIVSFGLLKLCHEEKYQGFHWR